jgi:hypothetical protein
MISSTDNLHAYGTSTFYRIFTVQSDISTLKSRITLFSDYSGYKQLKDNPVIVFRRGSKISTFFTSNQARLFSILTIQINSKDGTCDISVNVEIDTRGQIPGPEDKLFWDNELSNLMFILSYGKLPEGNSKNSAQRLARSQNRRHFIPAVIFISLLVIVFIPLILWSPDSLLPYAPIIMFCLIILVFFLTNLIYSKFFKK